MTVASIHLHALPFAWPVLWPMLEPAASRSEMTEADVRSVIEKGEAQLWAIVENKMPLAAVTTQITLIGEKGCRLWLVGGSRMNEWAEDFLAKVEPWARSFGCTHIWGTQSRKGWARIVKLMNGEPIEVDGKSAWMRRL